MRLSEHEALELDDIDRRLLDLLQDDCRTALVRLGEQVGLSAPSVLERIKKLEAAGIVDGYHAVLDAKRLGLDITAFIGVITGHPSAIAFTCCSNCPIAAGCPVMTPMNAVMSSPRRFASRTA